MFNELELIRNKKSINRKNGKVVDIYELLSNIDYYAKHIDEVNIGTSNEEKIVAMFVRDPRYGLGYKDLGRELMSQSKLAPRFIVKAGRFDDLFYEPNMYNMNFLLSELLMGNPLARKWMPRLRSKNRDLAKAFCRQFKMTEKEYRQLIKCETTIEYKLSYHEYENEVCVHPLIKSIKIDDIPVKAYNKYLNILKKSNLVSKQTKYKTLNKIKYDKNKRIINRILKDYKSKVIDI